MNTVPQYYSYSRRVAPSESEMRIDTEEVDGSSPFGPTISSRQAKAFHHRARRENPSFQN